MPEFGREELRQLTASLREFFNFQQRLGLKLVEGVGSVHAAKPEAVDTPPESPMSLEDTREEMGDCRRCKLWHSRSRLVFGVGDPKARLIFIGEGPGAEEDKQGEPFVGEAGQLFNRMLGKLELSRQEVYITNVVKCRPPKNRNPEAEEIAACRPFLLKQIKAIGPQIIVTLGAISTHALLESRVPISRLRGNWQQWQGIAVMPTFHPSYLLRAPQERLKTWDDMQKVMAAYRTQRTQ